MTSRNMISRNKVMYSGIDNRMEKGNEFIPDSRPVLVDFYMSISALPVVRMGDTGPYFHITKAGKFEYETFDNIKRKETEM